MKHPWFAIIVAAPLLFLPASARDTCDWKPGKWGVVGNYVYRTYFCQTTPTTGAARVTICCGLSKLKDADAHKVLEKVTARTGIPCNAPIRNGRSVSCETLVELLSEP